MTYASRGTSHVSTQNPARASIREQEESECSRTLAQTRNELARLNERLRNLDFLYEEALRKINNLTLMNEDLEARLKDATGGADAPTDTTLVIVIVILAVLVLCFLIASSITAFVCIRRRSKEKNNSTPMTEVVIHGSSTNPQQTAPQAPPEKPTKPGKWSATRRPKSEPTRILSTNTALEQKEDDEKTDLSMPLLGGNLGSLDLESQPDKAPPESMQQPRANPLAPDYIPPESFAHKGPLVIPKNQKFVLEHELDDQSDRQIKSTEHFEFDDKLNEVYDIGSEVEIIKSSVDKKRPAPSDDKSKGGGAETSVPGQPNLAAPTITAAESENKKESQPSDPDKKSAPIAKAPKTATKHHKRRRRRSKTKKPVAADPIKPRTKASDSSVVDPIGPRKRASDSSSGHAEKAKDPIDKSLDDNTFQSNKSAPDNTDGSIKMSTHHKTRKRPSAGTESTR